MKSAARLGDSAAVRCGSGSRRRGGAVWTAVLMPGTVERMSDCPVEARPVARRTAATTRRYASRQLTRRFSPPGRTAAAPVHSGVTEPTTQGLPPRRGWPARRFGTVRAGCSARARCETCADRSVLRLVAQVRAPATARPRPSSSPCASHTPRPGPAEPPDDEVLRLRVREVPAADRRARPHGHRLGERDPDPALHVEQRPERLLLGVVRAGGVAGRGPDPDVALGDELLVVRCSSGAYPQRSRRTRSCSRSANASASRSASDSSRIAL